MPKLSLTSSQGYIKISEGPCQLQIFHNYASLGIIHSATQPSIETAFDFELKPGNIAVSLGVEPCYVKALSEPLIVSYTDI